MAKFGNGKNLFVVLQCHDEGINNGKEVLARLDKKASLLFGLCQFAYILHDARDLDENGKEEGEHIHLLLNSPTAQSSDNWIKFFADNLGLKTDAVSVQTYTSERKCIRYLLHLDDPQKHQYNEEEVHTNMIGQCRRFWNSAGFVHNPTLEQLEKAYEDGPRGLYELVGMQNFEKAKRTIESIKQTDEVYNALIKKVQDLYSILCEFTANPRYLEKGYIPFQDFQAVLVAADSTLEEMLTIRKYQEERKKNK